AIALAGWFLAILPSDQSLNEAYFVKRWTIISGGNIAIGCFGALLLTKGHRRWRAILGAAATPAVGIVLWFSSLFPFLPHEHLRPIGIGLFVCWLFINQGGLITRALEFRPLRYIGKISYGVYMYQGLFLATGPNKWFPSVQWPLPWWAGLALLCIVAPLSYRYIEKPILRWKSSLPHRPAHNLIHGAPHRPSGPGRNLARSTA
ncbi:MAG: acyltransferase family protein, partial [Alphaproteobacteria bacterium]